MFKTAKVWWVLMTQIGPLSRAGREADQWIQRFIAEALQDDGLLQYLAEPRDYEQILTKGRASRPSGASQKPELSNQDPEPVEMGETHRNP